MYNSRTGHHPMIHSRPGRPKAGQGLVMMMMIYDDDDDDDLLIVKLLPCLLIDEVDPHRVLLWVEVVEGVIFIPGRIFNIYTWCGILNVYTWWNI